MAERCDAVVIGAGVIGLAVARELALAGREVLMLERNALIGAETSSRNSEVIHAGIYYPAGSVKAETCVRGKALLYDYCDQRHVPYNRLGKLIVATSRQHLEVLRGYQRQALRNGVGQLRWLDRDEALVLEPEVRCLAAVFSETTGVIDSHAFMLSLHGDVEAQGGIVSFHTDVTGLGREGGRLLVRCGDFDLAAQVVVNAAGLEAPQVASALGGQHRGYYAKGHYYALSGKSPFTHLVYPVADEGGLGVHVTLDLAGQARFGPDVVWIDEADYAFDLANRDRFVASIRKYYPAIDPDRLHPDYTGIRPKLAPAGSPASDFVIEGPCEHGIPGLVNLLGIESPGLTSSFAIAERVARMLA